MKKLILCLLHVSTDASIFVALHANTFRAMKKVVFREPNQSLEGGLIIDPLQQFVLAVIGESVLIFYLEHGLRWRTIKHAARITNGSFADAMGKSILLADAGGKIMLYNLQDENPDKTKRIFELSYDYRMKSLKVHMHLGCAVLLRQNKSETRSELIVIDFVKFATIFRKLLDFSYVDIGNIDLESNTFPLFLSHKDLSEQPSSVVQYWKIEKNMGVILDHELQPKTKIRFLINDLGEFDYASLEKNERQDSTFVFCQLKQKRISVIICSRAKEENQLLKSLVFGCYHGVLFACNSKRVIKDGLTEDLAAILENFQ